MKLSFELNGRKIETEAQAGLLLLDLLRSLGCMSVKRGCETANCGLCTVLVEEKPVLSCAVPALRVQGKRVTTLEGLQKEAEAFAGFMADQGADQCGFCNPGFVMNVLAMEKELDNPTEEQIREYLAGNLCRCGGFMSQHRAISAYLKYRKEERDAQ